MSEPKPRPTMMSHNTHDPMDQNCGKGCEGTKEHSSEPWSVGCWVGNLIHEKGGANIAETALDDVGILNAARIVACVNACKGMRDPAEEIEFLKGEADKAATQYENLKCDLSNLQTQLTAAQAEIAELKKAVIRAKDYYVESQTEVERLKADIQTLRGLLENEQASHRKSLSQDFRIEEALRAENQSLKAELAERWGDIKIIAGLNARIERMNEGLVCAEKYMSHTPICRSNSKWPCDCEFESAHAAVSKLINNQLAKEG